MAIEAERRWLLASFPAVESEASLPPVEGGTKAGNVVRKRADAAISAALVPAGGSRIASVAAGLATALTADLADLEDLPILRLCMEVVKL
jgi:hypothetical protein